MARLRGSELIQSLLGVIDEPFSWRKKIGLPMIYGILLVYYEEYYNVSILEFKKLLDCIDSNNCLIVVTNNPALVADVNGYLLGEDSQSEFSGYDAGLKSIKKFSSNDYVIFGNDTFCHHRHWSGFERRIFAKSIKNFVAQKNEGIVGEVDSFGQEFNLLDVKGSSWISTYLFCLSPNLLISLNKKIFLKKNVTTQLIYADSNNTLMWGSRISKNIIVQLTSWVSEKNKHGWYNKHSSIDSKVIKLRSILNEFYLSAYAESKGYKLINVYSGLNVFSLTRLKFRRIIRYLRLQLGL